MSNKFDKAVPVFFDTEFTGLNGIKDTELISIGFVTSRSDAAYFEITDFDIDLCGDWVKENVVEQLYSSIDYEAAKECSDNTELSFKKFGYYYKCGSKNEIAIAVHDWLEKLSLDYGTNGEHAQLQLVSDVSHYDMVLLCDLFGGAFNLPKWINPVCYDICQDLCRRSVYINSMFTGKNGLSLRWYPDLKYMAEAFDISRESLRERIAYNRVSNFPSGKKHNALYDARVIADLFLGVKAFPRDMVEEKIVEEAEHEQEVSRNSEGQ